MNERIKILMGETLDKHFSYTWSTMDYADVNKFAEKFAELIVEEMYDFVMEESASDNGIPDLGKVKQHFGVEE